MIFITSFLSNSGIKGYFSIKSNITFSHATKSKATGMSHSQSLATITRLCFAITHGLQSKMRYPPEINDFDVSGSVGHDEREENNQLNLAIGRYKAEL